MQKILLVFLGGGLGSCARYFFAKLNPFWAFLPLGTLTANLLSCFILGFVVGLIQIHFLKENWAKNLILIGFCGGFSTFSTFTNEILGFIKTENFVSLFTYISLSLILGNLCLLLGIFLAKQII